MVALTFQQPILQDRLQEPLNGAVVKDLGRLARLKLQVDVDAMSLVCTNQFSRCIEGEPLFVVGFNAFEKVVVGNREAAFAGSGEQIVHWHPAARAEGSGRARCGAWRRYFARYLLVWIRRFSMVVTLSNGVVWFGQSRLRARLPDSSWFSVVVEAPRDLPSGIGGPARREIDSILHGEGVIWQAIGFRPWPLD